MTGAHKLILITLVILVVVTFCAAAYLIAKYIIDPEHSLIARQPQVIPTRVIASPTATYTPLPSSTATPTATNTAAPTPTSTRVVDDTKTPTRGPTPTYTLVLTATPSGSGGSSGGGSGYGQATPTGTPTYPMKIVEGVPHDTENTFFVVYARIMIGDTLVPGYRIVGKNEPSGLYFESAPSCSDLCKASGPYIEYEECCNEQCTPIASPAPNYDVEEGNVAFEAPVYENGSYFLMVVDPEWQQVSETFEVPIDFEDRKWFYYVFRQ